MFVAMHFRDLAMEARALFDSSGALKVQTITSRKFALFTPSNAGKRDEDVRRAAKGG
jgi:hypothetical protein